MHVWGSDAGVDFRDPNDEEGDAHDDGEADGVDAAPDAGAFVK